MKAKLSQLRYKGSYNHAESIELPNGTFSKKNAALFEFRYGVKKNSLAYLVNKDMYPELKNTISIIARHDERFISGEKSYTISIGATTYSIINVDVDPEVNGMDVLTLKVVS